MSMTITMAILKAKQRLKSKWEGMLKLFYPTVVHSDGTHRHALSDGTHDHRPARRFEGLKFKPWMLEQVPSGGIQDDPHSDGIRIHDCRPASQWRAEAQQTNYFGGGIQYEPHSDGIHDYGRAWRAEAQQPNYFGGGIQDDPHSDGIHDYGPAWRAEAQQPNYFGDKVIPKQQGGSNSSWEGLLKGWEKGNAACRYPNYSEEDVVAWRVYEISQFFKVPKSIYALKIEYLDPAQFICWLDEIQGYVEFMEVAHELHSIDRLVPLLHHVLVYPHAGIRAKTAELVTAMVYNNPRSQKLVMELDGLDPLWFNFTEDLNATSRAKALGAISALIWNNKPGINAFQLANGYAELRDALSSESVLQREALNLIQYLLHENSSDCNTATELGLPSIMMQLASSDDAEVRVAALRGLLVLVRYEEGTYKKIRDKEGGNSGQLVKNDDKLKQVLQELIKRISAMAPEDLGAARKEISLVDSLWNACSNEPSSLKQFEPSLRAWAAAWIESCR